MRSFWINAPDDVDLAVLAEHNIVSCPLEVDDCSGILISEEYIAPALECMHLEAGENFDVGYEGIVGLHVHPRSTAGTPYVEIIEDEIDMEADMEADLETDIFAPESSEGATVVDEVGVTAAPLEETVAVPVRAKKPRRSSKAAAAETVVATEEAAVPALAVQVYMEATPHLMEAFRKDIVERLLPVIKRPIIVDCPHGIASEKPAIADDASPRPFHIKLWSSPVSKAHRSALPPTTIWGTPNAMMDSVFSPVRTGDTIETDEHFIIAEIFDNDYLYVYYDATHTPQENQLAIWGRLLDEVAIYFLPEEEKAARLAEIAEAKRLALRKMFIEACSGIVVKQVADAKRAERTALQNIDSYREALITSVRARDEAILKIETLQRAQNSYTEKLADEFENIRKFAHVKDISVTKSTSNPNATLLHVFTDMLTCVDPRTNKAHEIGEFKITLSIGGNTISWNNLTRKVHGYRENMNAPHVYPEGNACMGNLETSLPNLIAAYEFGSAAIVAIRFIESVNIQDTAGKHINRWPMVGESEGDYQKRLSGLLSGRIPPPRTTGE